MNSQQHDQTTVLRLWGTEGSYHNLVGMEIIQVSSIYICHIRGNNRRMHFIQDNNSCSDHEYRKWGRTENRLGYCTSSNSESNSNKDEYSNKDEINKERQRKSLKYLKVYWHSQVSLESKPWRISIIRSMTFDLYLFHSGIFQNANSGRVVITDGWKLSFPSGNKGIWAWLKVVNWRWNIVSES